MAGAIKFVSQALDDLSSHLWDRTRTGTVDEETPLTRDDSNGNSRRYAATTTARQVHGEGLPKVSRVISPQDAKKQAGKAKKLGTFSGVFVPTTLNIFSILMFLRFGFIIGQAGVLGTFGMLFASYLINLLTTLSVSAVSSNGTVRGGGAYYLISRCLGPEFGGSIGLVFYIGQVFNTGMNVVGLVNCIMSNYGVASGTDTLYFPEGFWWRYMYGTSIVAICTIVCLLGSSIFSKASTFLLMLLLVATFSIPISSIFQSPFTLPDIGVTYTGLRLKTLRQNMWPKFNSGAAGNEGGGEDWSSLFGILFPATAGIFAGASMSGDLKNPSRAIPRGTLDGLGFTFVTYILVILSLASSVTRQSFYTDLDVIQDINASPTLILIGEISTSFFSALMGIIGAAKCLQAIAKDDIFPGFKMFAKGTKSADEPLVAIALTIAITQLTLLANINQIASFVTMTYLMTFFGTNLACVLLKLSSAPNFRPSFRYFTWWTAAAGVLLSGVTMFFVDGAYASGCVSILITLFIIIHYTTPPKSWGDVSQSLIYHQVRKYLLRLKQEHVKFWRPQILLLVNDPRRSWKLIQFCNSMKKGGLYILGHIIVTPDFEESFSELKRQQSAWMKYIDFSKIKGFVHVSVAPTIEWGARNAVMSAGLGGMRPNIVVLGFYNLREFRETKNMPSISESKEDSKSVASAPDEHGQLPTDICRAEKAVGVTNYVNLLEDLLLSLQMNVAIAKGFNGLDLPKEHQKQKKKYIDLWPIQMAAEIADSETNTNLLTTNFDTYTLILQLGCILHTVPSWKDSYTLRVCVFVEYESDVAEEQLRVKKLLENLRIKAIVRVMWLSKGNLDSYEIIVNGKDIKSPVVDKVLGKEDWWRHLKRSRMKATSSRDIRSLVGMWPQASFHQGNDSDVGGLGRLFSKSVGKSTRHSLGGFSKIASALTMSMRTQKLHPGAEDTSDSDDSDYDVCESSSEASDDDGLESSSPKSESGRPGWLSNTPASRDYSRRASTGSALADILDGKAAEGSEVRRRLATQTTGKADSFSASASHSEANAASKRPKLEHRSSSPMFSSSAIPDTQVSTEEGSGPSISFVSPEEGPSRLSSKRPSLANLSHHGRPISFNDLPSKAQHLILNDLIRQNSGDTAVVFTTLPSPPSGTYKSEEDSLDYLAGLEVFTEGLPPVLLIHSNSLTVTTAL